MSDLDSRFNPPEDPAPARSARITSADAVPDDDTGVYRIDLPDNDFRQRRFLLGLDAFAIAGDLPDLPPTDLVIEKVWDCGVSHF